MCVAAIPILSYILSPFFLLEPVFLYQAKKSPLISRKGSSLFYQPVDYWETTVPGIGRFCGLFFLILILYTEVLAFLFS